VFPAAQPCDERARIVFRGEDIKKKNKLGDSRHRVKKKKKERKK